MEALPITPWPAPGQQASVPPSFAIANAQRVCARRPFAIPDIRDPAYRARLDAACRELAALPPAEAEADAAAGLANAFKYMSGWQ